MTVTRSLVSVVDDDESVRESLPDLLKEFGFAARAFSSPEEFLASDCVGQTKCLILDIAMPGMSGPDLQRELKLRGHEIPIIFITASTDKTVRPRLLEQGAVECLFKPFSDTALLEALNSALHLTRSESPHFDCGESADMKCCVTAGFRSRLRIVTSIPEARKREGVPTATVFPCPSDLKTDLVE